MTTLPPQRADATLRLGLEVPGRPLKPMPSRDGRSITIDHATGLIHRHHPHEPNAVERRSIPSWKRIFDLGLTLLTAPIWLPLMSAISCYIRLVSPGPVIFRQERVGHGGRRFHCLKFRSMHVGTETHTHEGHLDTLIRADSPMTKLDAHHDPRLIRFGRFFRATGLDELPQIFNVLRGEMSLVGPRPCTSFEFERYEPWQKRRFMTLPGLTGYWQVNGKNKTTFRRMIEMDIYYGREMSPQLDVAILLRTIPALASQVAESWVRPMPAAPPSGQPAPEWC